MPVPFTRVRGALCAVALLAVVVTSGAGRFEPVAAATPSPAVGPAAAWLAGLVGPDGSVENPYDPGVPSAAWTVNVALSLVSGGTQPAALAAARGYIEAHVDDYVVRSSVDNPGALGYLIMLAVATGADPSSFGTPPTDLVVRLSASLGTDQPGVFGVPDAFSAVTNQSLALLGLVAAGETPPTSAVDWLVAQQCVGAGTPAAALGGWQPYRAPAAGGLEACVAPDPVNFAGPDTNSTAFAVQALVAVDATTGVPAALDFFATAQPATGPYAGGFANYPGIDADPNSTALVIQALVAAGESLVTWTAGGATALDSLGAWVIVSGPETGALASPYSGGFADLFATYQGVWGLALTPFPFVAPIAVVPVVPPTTTAVAELGAEPVAQAVVVAASFTG